MSSPDIELVHHIPPWLSFEELKALDTTPNQPDPPYTTAYVLRSMVSYKNIPLLQLLLERSLDINENYQPYGLSEASLLLSSLTNSHTNTVDFVKVLCEAGAELETRTKIDRTALLVAARMGYHEALEVLIKAGADMYALETPQSDSIPSYRPVVKKNIIALALVTPQNALKTCETLFRYGFELSYLDNLGQILLSTYHPRAQTPQQHNQHQIFKLLLEHLSGDKLLPILKQWGERKADTTQIGFGYVSAQEKLSISELEQYLAAHLQKAELEKKINQVDLAKKSDTLVPTDKKHKI